MLNSFQHPSCRKDKLPQVERWALKQVQGDDEEGRVALAQRENKKRTFLHTRFCGLSCRMIHHALLTLAPAHGDPAPPRCNADYRWTPAKAMAFLEALAVCGKVAEAARGVGMTRQAAYRLRSRSAFVAQGWPLALAAGKARRRARGRVRRRQWPAQGDASGAAR
jgi:hypothetical protein